MPLTPGLSEVVVVILARGPECRSRDQQIDVVGQPLAPGEVILLLGIQILVRSGDFETVDRHTLRVTTFTTPKSAFWP